MTTLPFPATTPVSVSRVGLRARDAGGLADYYRHILGLEEERHAENRIGLGAGGRELLEIEGSPALKPDDPRAAGLFHTAFLLPTRQDLARWLIYSRSAGIELDGASDHAVSEALYLTDPEGNGVEIYADRPSGEWRRREEEAVSLTLPLDIGDLLASIDGDGAVWQGAPELTMVGHAHLRVGDPDEAERWWHEQMGLETRAKIPDQAVFLSTGGYHHHIGANSWRSRGAGPREKDRAGLAFVELSSRDASTERVDADPWGNEIRVLPRKD